MDANPLIGAFPLWKGMLKRTVDIVAALFGLLLLAPLLLIVAFLVLFGSGIPILHREPRIGRFGRPFKLCKFRTLKRKAAKDNVIVAPGDPRITRVGRLLRRTRLDELPHLFNLLRGDMSLVGPRPMTPRQLNTLDRAVCQALLSVRPGLTDPASVLYFAEDDVLAGRPNAEAEYLEKLLPARVRVQLNYLWTWRPGLDIRILVQTQMRIWSHRARENSKRQVQAVLESGADAERPRAQAPRPPPP